MPCPALPITAAARDRADPMAQDPVAQVKKLFYRRLRVGIMPVHGGDTGQPVTVRSWAHGLTCIACFVSAGPSEGRKNGYGRFPVL